MADLPIEQWNQRLQSALSRSGGFFDQIRLLREVDSTQNEAKKTSARPGEIIAAGRQTAGRGRLGRRWADTGPFGLAATFVVHPDRSERLSIACAVAVASAVERFTRAHVQIKWPNDILIGDRKLAGILIESTAEATFIGIGINVLQGAWRGGLEARAISLSEAGAETSRVEVLAALIETLPQALQLGDEAMLAFFRARDCMTGRQATLLHDGRRFTGRILRIEPWIGLTISTAEGEVVLPAATTSILDRSPDILSGPEVAGCPMKKEDA